MNTQEDKTLQTFLRKLADDIEQKTLTEKQLQTVGEFYISYINPENPENNLEKDWKKYLTMGWYVYECLLKK